MASDAKSKEPTMLLVAPQEAKKTLLNIDGLGIDEAEVTKMLMLIN